MYLLRKNQLTAAETSQATSLSAPGICKADLLSKQSKSLLLKNSRKSDWVIIGFDFSPVSEPNYHTLQTERNERTPSFRKWIFS